MSARIAVIAGDGIGQEVTPVAMDIVNRAADLLNINLEWTHLDWSCERYLKTGQFIPNGGLERLKDFDAIFLGAVGHEAVSDHESLWGLLLPIRRELQQSINLRPIKLFEGVESPLVNKNSSDIDFYVVRENNEGEYSNIGGRMNSGDGEVANQLSVFTQQGCDRVMDFAFQLAANSGRGRVTSATKSNGIMHTMPFWDERFEVITKRYPTILSESFHIDILAAHLVSRPEHFDVIVASNLFGDILSDLGASIAGSIGIAASANINPSGEFPSMFEPVHGSAPDIAGLGIANPIGQIWSGALMLKHLGYEAAYRMIMSAVEESLKQGDHLTPDLGGQATTVQLGKVIADGLTVN